MVKKDAGGREGGKKASCSCKAATADNYYRSSSPRDGKGQETSQQHSGNISPNQRQLKGYITFRGKCGKIEVR